MARIVVLVFLNRAWNAGCFFLLSFSLSPKKKSPSRTNKRFEVAATTYAEGNARNLRYIIKYYRLYQTKNYL